LSGRKNLTAPDRTGKRKPAGPRHNRFVTGRLLLAAGILASATGAAAHHSIAAVYDRNASITLEGVVSEFRLVNPHAFLTMAVERDGRAEAWKLELDNRAELADIGVRSDTLKPGDRIVATGSRARDGSRSIYALRLDRGADGFWYEQVGSSPRIGRNGRTR
jgi:hypothetical protein